MKRSYSKGVLLVVLFTSIIPWILPGGVGLMRAAELPKSTPREQGLVHPDYEEKGFHNALGILYQGMVEKQEQANHDREAWERQAELYRQAQNRERAAQAELNRVPAGNLPAGELRDRVAAAGLGIQQARASLMQAWKAYANAKETAAVAREKYSQQESAIRRQEELQSLANLPQPVADPLSPQGQLDCANLRTLDELHAILHLTLNEADALAKYEAFAQNAAPGTNTLDSPEYRAVEAASEQKKQVVDRVLTGTLDEAEGSAMEPRCSRCGLPLSLFNRACKGN
jgi:hypothetical protein